jgi:serine phosphatase RsbU (regulator of sigma subunit)
MELDVLKEIASGSRKKPLILIVDDINDTSETLETLLADLELVSEYFRIEKAESGSEALEIVNEERDNGRGIAIIISDQRLGENSGDYGHNLLSEIHRISPETINIIYSGNLLLQDLGEAVNKAALFGYFAKPWENEQVRILVRQAAMRYLQQRELENYQHSLEIKVQQRTEELEQKNRDILESIQYASRIQQIILPGSELLQQHLGGYSVFYQPRNIVSGDFYWFEHLKEESVSVLAVVDCTGHGVPGAIMSVIGYNALSRIVGEQQLRHPDQILIAIDQYVRKALKQDDPESLSNDGMDMAICTIYHLTGAVELASAQRPIYLVRKQATEIEIIEPSKYPIGGAYNNINKEFKPTTLQLESGDRLYFFSDGVPDQFGGPQNKKFSAKRLRELLMSLQTQPITTHGPELAKAFFEWQGTEEQVDDATFFAFELH